MSLFIQVENQTIVWETIHKIPVLHIVFPEDSENTYKIQWFKSHIEKKYAQLPPTISRNDLYKINREVLAGMVDHLQILSSNRPNIQRQDTRIDVSQPTFSRMQNSAASKPNYENTELQYKSLFDIPKPKVIDFSEKIEEEETITNELIENHKKMREQELQQYLPAPITTPSLSKLSILEPIQKEELRPILVEEKHVSFQLPELQREPTTDYTELYKKYENLEKKVDQMLELLVKDPEYIDIIKIIQMSEK